jgi:putative transposase
MPRKRFTEEQIAFALRQHEGGTQIAEIIRKLGVTEQDVLPLEEKVRRLGRR